jgi:hypothetical protein
MLDIGGESAYIDYIDDDEPQVIEGKKGYSPMDILNFCNDHKIRCFGYDWMMKEFISNRDLNIDFHSHLPEFVFYFNDHHIYLINYKDVRHALLNCNKTVNVCALAKEKKQKIFTKDLIIDAPFEHWKYYNKLIFISVKIEFYTIIFISSLVLVMCGMFGLEQVKKKVLYNLKMRMSI